MSEQLEIEFKNMLTQKEYATLLTHFVATEKDFFTQSNSYYDTPDWQLKNKGAGLRIRLLPAKAELTLKTPFQDGLLETTDSLTLEDAKKFIKKETIFLEGAVAKKLSELGIDPKELILLGTLTTKRFEKTLPEGLIVLDESQYGTITDYELEVEVENYSTGKSFFYELLNKHHLPIRPAKHKIARMIEETVH